jgi:hypothetical protein
MCVIKNKEANKGCLLEVVISAASVGGKFGIRLPKGTRKPVAMLNENSICKLEVDSSALEFQN